MAQMVAIWPLPAADREAGTDRTGSVKSRDPKSRMMSQKYGVARSQRREIEKIGGQKEKKCWKKRILFFFLTFN